MRACDLHQNKQHQHRPAPPADLGDVPGPELFSKTASVHRIVLTQLDVFITACQLIDFPAFLSLV